MVKISIVLPNQTEISLEAADPDQLRPMVEMVRQQLLVDLANLTTPPNRGAVTATDNRNGEKGTGEQPPEAPSPPKPQPPSQADNPPTPSETPGGPAEEPVPEPEAQPGSDSKSPNGAAVPPGLSDPRLVRDFTVFCRAADPISDMRKVVAAAEGARRYLNMDNVDAWELGHLFDLAGWKRPPNFTQTLRNAARTSFRWLERVHGRSGRYTTTEKGRSAALGGPPAS